MSLEFDWEDWWLGPLFDHGEAIDGTKFLSLGPLIIRWGKVLRHCPPYEP
jgi:hypothetical protein